MRVTDAALFGLTGAVATAVLVGTAAGLFADPPPDVVPPPRPPAAMEPAPPPVPAPQLAQALPPAPPAAAERAAPTPAAPPAPGEWRVPDHADVKAVRPPADSGELPVLARVLTPGEQQAAWAARDKLANESRALHGGPPPLALTRLHDGPPPDKAVAQQ
jgi:hypothetical protein